MGIVWEAERADGQYEQRAAVKLLPASLLSGSDIRRFREERQILARLTHPGIAGLLDGGTLEDGSPFLVMEYIEGCALDSWCESRHCGLRERLELFLSVCTAVEYAHRHLVVHRDLKPTNILVTPEGTPTLLDFGIARLIDGDRRDTDSTKLRLTPAYASPEQLRGEAVTTASDIFSLGVLLYVLLTGRKPHATGADMVETLRAICEEDPPRPSSVAGANARHLRGEVDAITLQALRTDPEERYHSVRALADDVRACMEGRPVSAVPPGWWRRSTKFIRRNKTQSAAAALAIVSLVAGTGVSLWQAGVAQHQRERAENRFRDVQKFSRSVLFELHEAIRDLPGSTPARNLLLDRATEFLDNLAKDSASDAGLQVELAEGYRRLGHVQGSTFSDNIGRRDAAIGSFRKAVRLGEQAPANADAGIVLLGAYDDLSSALWNNNDRSEADWWYQKHRNLVAVLEARFPNDNKVRSSIASSYSELAFYRSQRNDLAGAKDDYRKALRIFPALLQSGYSPAELGAQYAFALKRLGAILIVGNSLDEAENCYGTALGMEDKALAASSGDFKLQIDRTFTLSDLALIRKKRKDLPAAARIYEGVAATRRSALASDPRNVRYMSLTASAAANLADVYAQLQRHREAIELAREALRLRDRAAAAGKGAHERWDAGAARILLASKLLSSPEDSAPATARLRWIAEARATLDEVRPFTDGLARNPKPSRSDRAALEDYRDARDRLRRLAPLH